MYAEHPNFTPPPDNAVLWRYMDFTKFVSLLVRNELFFVRADKLKDPFEGTWTNVNVEAAEAFYNSLPERALQGNRIHMDREMRRFALINCWHENCNESAAMWSLYSREMDGIAIKTDFSSFRQSLVGETDIYIGRVNYIDYESDFIPRGNAFNPFLHKRNSFEHEREVRAMYIKLSERGFVQDVCKIGIYDKVDLSLLIHEVVVAPLAEDWFLDLIKSVADQYDLEAPVRKSSLAVAPAWTRF